METRDFCRPAGTSSSAFDTTHWSLVVAARDGDGDEALEALCRAYWYPVFCYVRRKGYSPADAQDLTQEFFYRLINKRSLEAVDRNRGSFRAFLLTSVNHLLANEWDKARALKRGGHMKVVSFDADEAECRYARELATQDSPEKAFDRRWAVTLLERGIAQMREEAIRAGRLPQFEVLKRFLSDTPGPGEYALLDEELKMEPGGVAVLVHRLRQRYREIIRTEIAETVSGKEELRAEMRHLFSSLA